ncbi:MAG: NAD(P)H-hydrate dehydratase [Porcipelethomonas sp.]
MLLVTPEQMKILEAESDRCGTSYAQLMENAGKSLADSIEKVSADPKKILFLCGNGNNAGDCFAASRHLSRNGWTVILAMLCGKPKTDISAAAFERSEASQIIWDYDEIYDFLQYGEYSVLADGVFGTGFHGELPEHIKKIFSAAKGFKIAVDVPSGGDCATGCVSDGTFRADMTVTFAYQKFGTAQYPLKSFCGNILVSDIGIDMKAEKHIDRKICISEYENLKNVIPVKEPDAHKGKFGRLLTVCGSRKMPGACMMSAAAAARCGTGLITVSSVAENIPALSVNLPEIMYEPLISDENGFMKKESAESIIKASEKATAVLIGCGIGVTDGTRHLVKELIRKINCPIILDADGINCIQDSIDIIREKRSGIVITPHPAEMSRLTGKSVSEIQSDRLCCAREFSAEYGVITVLKGAGTIITNGDASFVNPTGNPGMGKGGSGDILSGMIASFAAQGIGLMEAAVLGVYLHGLAGDRAAGKLSMQSMLPTDMLNELPEIFKEMEK